MRVRPPLGFQPNGGTTHGTSVLIGFNPRRITSPRGFAVVIAVAVVGGASSFEAMAETDGPSVEAPIRSEPPVAPSPEESADSEEAHRSLNAGEVRALAETTFGSLIAELNATPLEKVDGELALTSPHEGVLRDNGSSELVYSSVPFVVPPEASSQESYGSSDVVSPLLPDHETAGPLSESPSTDIEGDPIDLELRESADRFVPREPLVDVVLPQQVSEGATLPDSSLTVFPQSAPTAGDGIRMEGREAVIYPETAEDTDTILAAHPRGLETFVQLRSPASPEVVTLDLALPANAVADQVDGSGAVRITKDGQPLAFVPPAFAQDATGRSVAVETSLVGGEISMAVSHRGGDIVYPILVDPLIQQSRWRDDPAPGLSTGWEEVSSAPFAVRGTCKLDLRCYGDPDPSFYYSPGYTGNKADMGLYVYGKEGARTVNGNTAYWRYRVPRFGDTTAYINSVLGEVTYTRRSDTSTSPYGYVGIINEAQSWWTGLSTWTTDASDSYFNLDPGSQTWQAPLQTGKEIRVGLYGNQTHTLSKWREIYLGEIFLTVADPETPQFGANYSQPDAWGPHRSYGQTLAADDPGLGVDLLGSALIWAREDPQGPGGYRFVANELVAPDICSGLNTSPCPKHRDLAHEFSTETVPATSLDPPPPGLPEGISLLYGVAAEPQSLPNNFLNKLRPIRIDEDGPELELSGGLADASAGRDLRVEATDGANRDPDATDFQLELPATNLEIYRDLDARAMLDARSGVASMKLFVDGELEDTASWSCEALYGSCAREHTFNVDPAISGGRHEIELVVTDHAGNESREKWTEAFAGQTAPEPHRLGLEHYFQYDTLEAGAESSANVNLGSGNLVWHQTPISNPGRGLASTVNLTYNSHDWPLLGDLPLDSDFLGLDYDEAGPGFSLGGSGITRVNEPLGGVLIPSLHGGPGSVTLTDPDGTLHEFEPKLDQLTTDCPVGVPLEYEEPSGMNLRLRRFGCLGEDLMRLLEDTLPIKRVDGDDLGTLKLNELLPGRSGRPSLDLKALADLSHLETGRLFDALYLLEQEDLWAATRPDGVTHYFDGFGYERAIEDRDDNRIEFEYEKVNALGEPCDLGAGSLLAKLFPDEVIVEAPILPPVCEPRLKAVVDASGNDEDTEGEEDDPDRDERSIDFDYYGLEDLELGTNVLGELIDDLDTLVNQDTAALSDLDAQIQTALGTANVGRVFWLGKVKSITDHGERRLEFRLDNLGRLSQLVEAAGSPAERATGFEYDGSVTLPIVSHPQLKSITDPNGMATEDGDGTVTTAADRDGMTEFEYHPPELGDAGRRVKRVYDRNLPTGGGAKTDFRAYEYKDTLSEHWADVTTARDRSPGYGTKSRVRFAAGDDKPSFIDEAIGDGAAARTTALTWDSDNNVTQMVAAQGTPDEATSAFTYNPNGALTSQTDPLGRTTTLAYCDHPGTQRSRTFSEDTGSFVSDPVSLTRPKPGSLWRHEIDGVARGSSSDSAYCGALKSRPGGIVGHQTAQIDPLGKVSRTAYDTATGVVTSETNEEGEKTEYRQHDPSGLPQQIVDPEGFDNDEANDLAKHTWAYRYDALGRIEAVTDPRGSAEVSPGSPAGSGHSFTTTLTYDALDRLTREVIPKDSQGGDFISRTYVYDRNGNMTSRTDGEGKVTDATYTATDLLATELTPPVPVEGQAGLERLRTDYRYDPEEALVAVTSPKGTVTAGPGDFETEFHLDSLGRRLASVRKGGATQSLITSYGYDRRDNLRYVIDPNRNRGRTPSQAIFHAVLGASPRLTNVYDAADQLTASIEDPSGKALRASYGYDQNGNQTTRVSPRGMTAGASPSDFTTTSAYNARDELIATTDPLGNMWRTEYDGAGRPSAEIDPRAPSTSSQGDYTTRFTYDDNGYLTSRSVPYVQGQYGLPESELQSWAVRYERNAVGDPISITDARGNSFTNEFLDTGALSGTERPSWWNLDWGGGQANPNGGRRFDATGGAGASADLAVPVGGPRLGESGSAAGGGASTISGPQLPSSPGAGGDFGFSSRQELSQGMPRAGLTKLSYDDEMRVTELKEAPKAPGAEPTDRKIAYDALGRITTKSFDYTLPAELSQGGQAQLQPIQHSFGYDPNSNLARSTNGRGHATTYSYDQFDRRISEVAPGSSPQLGTAPTPETTGFEYDPNGNLTKRLTPRGSLDFRFQYDALDRMVEETNPANESWLYRYDPNGNVVSEKTPRLNETAVAFDRADRVASMTEAIGSDVEREITFGYDAAGNRTQTVSPGAENADGVAVNPVQTQVFDARGLPWKSTISGRTAGGQTSPIRTTITEYDPNGNLRRTVNPAGVMGHGQSATPLAGYAEAASDSAEQARVGVYDEDNLLREVHLPWGDELQDPDASTPAQTEENQKRFVQSFGYDGRGAVEEVIDPRQPSASADPRIKTRYVTNELGWITSQSSPGVPGEKAISYAYDQQGNQVGWSTSTNNSQPSVALDREVRQTYYPSGLLERRTGQITAQGPCTPQCEHRKYEYFYNKNRSLTEVRDYPHAYYQWLQGSGARVTQIGRDDAERETNAVEAWTGGKDTLFRYDPDGNVTRRYTDGDYDASKDLPGRSDFYAQGKRAAFTYDELGREENAVLSSLSAAGEPTGQARTTATEYFPSGDVDRVSRTYDQGTSPSVTESFAWGADGLMQRRVRDPRSGSAETHDYSYDRNGNRTHDERGDHAYNARDQLVYWNPQDSDPGSDGPVTYDLDASGQIEREVDSSGPTTNYAYDPQTGRLSSVTTAGQSASYAYDDLGNVVRIQSHATSTQPDPIPAAADICDTNKYTGDTTTYFCFDEFSRPVYQRGGTVEDADSTDFFVYDGLDRRDARIKFGATVSTREFSYVGTSQLVSQEQRKSGTEATYDYDSSGRRLGQVHGQDGYRSYSHDANGSVEAIEGPGGQVASGSEYAYDPYGDLQMPETDLSGEAKQNPFRFEGFYYESEIKSYDMLARHYQPEVGRFLSEDRYQDAGADLALESDPLTQNRYVFAGGNPVSRVEWDGHYGCTSTCDGGDTQVGKGGHKQELPGAQTAPVSQAAIAQAQAGATAVASLPTPDRLIDRKYALLTEIQANPGNAVGSGPRQISDISLEELQGEYAIAEEACPGCRSDPLTFKEWLTVASFAPLPSSWVSAPARLCVKVCDDISRATGRILGGGTDETVEAGVRSADDLPRIAGGAPKPGELPFNARSTKSFDYIADRLDEFHGINRTTASERLHQIKYEVGRGPADDVLFDLTGNVYDPRTRELLGSLTQGGARR